MEALALIGDPASLPLFKKSLDDTDARIRQAALRGLAEQRDEADRKLIAGRYDEWFSWHDPAEIFSQHEISEASKRLRLSNSEVSRRLEAMARDFGLRMEARGARPKRSRSKKK